LGVSVTDGRQVIAALGFQKARTPKDNVPANVGLEQPNVPNQMASLWTQYQIRDGNFGGLRLELGINYVGERAGQRDSVPRSFSLDAYTTFNGLISYVRGQHKFALNIENITDERYIQLGQARLADPGEHRSFRLTYTHIF